MTTPNLSEVRTRLEEAVEHMATVRPDDDRLELYHEAATAILDSQFQNYPEGALEAYLANYLQQLR